MKVPTVIGARPQFIKSAGISLGGNIMLIEPVSYLDMLWLEKNACMILTDSGGMQKEAYWAGVPCITLREETEWVETVQTGWNVIAGMDQARIMAAVKGFPPPSSHPSLFGAGDASLKIVRHLMYEKRK